MLAYPGIEVVNFEGNLQDVDDKQAITVDHFHSQHDQKQAVLWHDSTDTSMGCLDDGALRCKNDSPPSPLVQSVSNRSRRANWLKLCCILVITITIVVVVPVGVEVSRKKRWGFARFYI